MPHASPPRRHRQGSLLAPPSHHRHPCLVKRLPLTVLLAGAVAVALLASFAPHAHCVPAGRGLLLSARAAADATPSNSTTADATTTATSALASSSSSSLLTSSALTFSTSTTTSPLTSSSTATFVFSTQRPVVASASRQVRAARASTRPPPPASAPPAPSSPPVAAPAPPVAAPAPEPPVTAPPILITAIGVGPGPAPTSTSAIASPSTTPIKNRSFPGPISPVPSSSSTTAATTSTSAAGNDGFEGFTPTLTTPVPTPTEGTPPVGNLLGSGFDRLIISPSSSSTPVPTPIPSSVVAIPPPEGDQRLGQASEPVVRVNPPVVSSLQSSPGISSSDNSNNNGNNNNNVAASAGNGATADQGAQSPSSPADTPAQSGGSPAPAQPAAQQPSGPGSVGSVSNSGSDTGPASASSKSSSLFTIMGGVGAAALLVGVVGVSYQRSRRDGAGLAGLIGRGGPRPSERGMQENGMASQTMTARALGDGFSVPAVPTPPKLVALGGASPFASPSFDSESVRNVPYGWTAPGGGMVPTRVKRTASMNYRASVTLGSFNPAAMSSMQSAMDGAAAPRTGAPPTATHMSAQSLAVAPSPTDAGSVAELQIGPLAHVQPDMRHMSVYTLGSARDSVSSSDMSLTAALAALGDVAPVPAHPRYSDANADDRSQIAPSASASAAVYAGGDRSFQRDSVESDAPSSTFSFHASAIAAAAAAAGLPAGVLPSPPPMPGARRVAIPYLPELEDELALSRGEWVVVDQVFQDNWAVGQNVSTGMSGAFPVVCLE
ncbi:hypothetical protein BC828DRAFT_405998 [Blastocladiella britannica]|nr:hypothetical protein BC828DRAFT_405998 [Blastocladiella britannica]